MIGCNLGSNLKVEVKQKYCLKGSVSSYVLVHAEKKTSLVSKKLGSLML